MHVVPIKTIQNINGHDNAKAEFFLRKETSHGDTDQLKFSRMFCMSLTLGDQQELEHIRAKVMTQSLGAASGLFPVIFREFVGCAMINPAP